MMKLINTSMRNFALTTLLIVCTSTGFSQIYGGEGYLIGTAAEVGLSGQWGYEGSDINLGQPPTPIHFRSNSFNLFGFVADPTFSGWVNFDGDFFTPGSPENGWGMEIGGSSGISLHNNCSSGGINDIPGALSNYVNNAGCMSIDWNGGTSASGVDVSVAITYSMKQNDLFYTTEVTITNDGATALDSIFYYRNVDPDNNVELSGSYQTTNTIVANPPSTCNKAHVTAEQTTPWDSYLGFAAIGENFRVCHGGFSNRNASNMWFGNTAIPLTTTVGSVTNADEAISLSYLIETIPPGGSETFKFVVILNAAGADAAFDNLFALDYVGSAATGAECVPTVDTTYVVPGSTGALGTPCSDSVLVEITGSAVNDFTWSWSPAIGLSTTTGSSVYAFPTTTTTYTATGTSISGCFATPVIKEIVVIPSAADDPTVTPAGPYCPGDPIEVMTAVDPGGEWGASCGTCIDPITGAFNPGSLPAGTYTIWYGFAGGGGICPLSDSIDVIIGGLNPPIIDPAGPFCDGPASYAMTSNAGGGVWSADCGTCIDAAGNFDPSVPGIGSYEIYYSIGGACGGNDTIIVDVQNDLDASVSAVTTPLCDVSSPITMVGATPGGTWSATCPTCIDAVTGEFDPSVGAGTYMIYYNFTGACSAVDSTVVVVETGLDATITPAGPFCDYDAAAALVGATPGGVWSSTCSACIDPVTGIFDPVLASAGFHDITYTITSTCVSFSVATVYVDSIEVAPAAAIDPDCFEGCNGSITVNATNATEFSIDNGLSFQPSNNFTGLCSGTYDIVVESINGCRATTNSVINDPPELIISIIAQDAICDGACDGSINAIVNGGTVSAGYNYNWSGGIAASTDANAINLCAGTYDLVVNDDLGCAVDSIGIVIEDLPPLDPGVNVLLDESCFEFCDGQIEITGTTGVLFTLTGSGGTQNNSTGIFTGLCAGDFDLTIQDGNGCFAYSTGTLILPDQVIADFTFGPQPTSFMESEITFTNMSLNAEIYNWTFTPDVATPTSTETNPVVEFPNTEAGIYQACLTASNANGCDSVVCKTIIIDPEFIIYAPNAFTPDGDGINDTWMPVLQGADPEAFEVYIFNRWGELLWSSETLGVAWDGVDSAISSVVKSDVYVWRIKAKDIMLGEKHDYKGHVTVIK
ncbi:gliding motility-associated C-terminal domain-containing protein [Flavobacteriales bacterium]|nr:gliding motility-associated C-terminal domain-containing protein [Flavobacteriales bacterium]